MKTIRILALANTNQIFFKGILYMFSPTPHFSLQMFLYKYCQSMSIVNNTFQVTVHILCRKIYIETVKYERHLQNSANWALPTEIITPIYVEY